MEFTKAMVFLSFMIARIGSSMAAEKQVDWTVGKDYKDWASDHEFQAGDTLVFQYDAQYHNVLQVSKEDYKSCSRASPMASYSSGRDSIPLVAHGSYYFICGFPGHCESGQKLKIKVKKSDQNGEETNTNTTGQTSVNPRTPNCVPMPKSSSPLSTANWLTATGACVGIFVASYFYGFFL